MDSLMIDMVERMDTLARDVEKLKTENGHLSERLATLNAENKEQNDALASFASFVNANVLRYAMVWPPNHAIESQEGLLSLRSLKTLKCMLDACLRQPSIASFVAYDGPCIMYGIDWAAMKYRIKVYVLLANGSFVNKIAAALDVADLANWSSAELISWDAFDEETRHPVGDVRML
jgi:hypothetical protein